MMRKEVITAWLEGDRSQPAQCRRDLVRKDNTELIPGSVDCHLDQWYEGHGCGGSRGRFDKCCG